MKKARRVKGNKLRCSTESCYCYADVEFEVGEHGDARLYCITHLPAEYKLLVKRGQL